MAPSRGRRGIVSRAIVPPATHYSLPTTHDSRLTTHDSRLTSHETPYFLLDSVERQEAGGGGYLVRFDDGDVMTLSKAELHKVLLPAVEEEAAGEAEAAEEEQEEAAEAVEAAAAARAARYDVSREHIEMMGLAEAEAAGPAGCLVINEVEALLKTRFDRHCDVVRVLLRPTPPLALGLTLTLTLTPTLTLTRTLTRTLTLTLNLRTQP